MLKPHRIVVSLVVLVTVACSANATPDRPGFTAPRWEKPVKATIPADVTTLSRDAASWDGGALLAGNGLQPSLITSTDLTTWRHTMPDDVVDLTYHPIAGHGPAAYVLGSSYDGVVVWRTENGDTWRPVPLPGARPHDPYLSIAAGPKGVVVAGYTSTEYVTWYSSDGTAFEQATAIPATAIPATAIPATDLYESDGVQVTATANGFLLTNDSRGGGVHESTDGRHWTLATGLPDAMFDAVGRSGGTTVAVTTWFADGSEEKPGLSAYFHRTRDERWTEGTIDLGKLPDVGVEPRAAQYVWGVAEWGGGFVAYGGTRGGAGVGTVWTSPDGAKWTRLSTKDNGFDRAPVVFAAVRSGGGIALLGMDLSINGPGLTVWRSVA